MLCGAAGVIRTSTITTMKSCGHFALFTGLPPTTNINEYLTKTLDPGLILKL
jgi:hypothetical protein